VHQKDNLTEGTKEAELLARSAKPEAAAILVQSPAGAVEQTSGPPAASSCSGTGLIDAGKRSISLGNRLSKCWSGTLA